MIKQLMFRAAHASGVTARVAGSPWRQSRLSILCYHGVSMADEHIWNPRLFVSPTRLRERLAYLKANDYTILPLGEAVARLATRTLPPRAVAITFDDGTIDFATKAVPILREFDAPATVYLTTYYCLNRFPIFDTALSYLLWRGRDSSAELSDLANARSPLPIDTEAGRMTAWQAIYAHAAQCKLSAAEKNELLRRVAQRTGTDFDAFVASGILQIMTPEQVRGIATQGIDVELHTHRHRTPRDRAAFDREVAENQTAIAEILGDTSPRRHFCYPSGDYDEAFLPWLRQAGVETSTTCIPGLAAPVSPRLLLPRILDTETMPLAGFASWTSGFAEMLPRSSAYKLELYRPAIQST
jgi:peptidoglycan/xylan/chitin deacetylase (PgdA/CDA1 family)